MRKAFAGVWRWMLAAASIAVLAASPALAQSPTAVSYVISFPSLEQHLVHVLMIVPEGSQQVDLQLPVWNALYQVRDFSQYMNWIRASDRNAKPLALHEVNPGRWHIDHAEGGAYVEYEMYADSPAPFGAQVNTHHAFLNLAQVLIYPVEFRKSPVTLRFDLKNQWKTATPLKAGVDQFIADHYDELVDSPVEIGDFQQFDFDESGGHFRVIVDADAADYDGTKLVATLHRIVAAAISWMNDRPFDTYTFIYHFPRGPAGGGMEHAYSTAISLSADVLRQNLSVFTSVTSHEFFHLWNVKRIRPQSLEPVDYAKENYTRALWFSEGVTSTAQEVIQFRAGLIDEKQFLRNLGDEIGELERRPAHLTQSAENSSLDAWLEGLDYYRRPERSISYYNKGELLGVMLDLALRENSHGHASLRELLQWMNANYAKKGRFFDDSSGLREAAEAVTHSDFSSFFSRYVAGTEEIPWNDFLRSVGLHAEAVHITTADFGFTATRNSDGPVTVGAVTSGGQAEHAGLRSGDAIIELQGQPPGQDARDALSRLNPGDTISVTVQPRRGPQRELKWKVGAREELTYEVRDLDHVSAEQHARRNAWMRGEAEPAAAGASAP